MNRMLQYVAVCCKRMLQCVAVCCKRISCNMRGIDYMCTAVCCSMCVAVCCSVLQCVAVWSWCTMCATVCVASVLQCDSVWFTLSLANLTPPHSVCVTVYSVCFSVCFSVCCSVSCSVTQGDLLCVLRISHSNSTWCVLQCVFHRVLQRMLQCDSAWFTFVLRMPCYRAAKTHRTPHLYRSFSAKEPYD